MRRAAQALAAVAVAALAAGLRGAELPFTREAAAWPDPAATESAVDAATWLGRGVPIQLVLGAVALAAVAVAIPYARSPWRIAALGAGGLALVVAAAPAAPALPVVAAIWLTCAGLVLRTEH